MSFWGNNICLWLVDFDYANNGLIDKYDNGLLYCTCLVLTRTKETCFWWMMTMKDTQNKYNIFV